MRVAQNEHRRSQPSWTLSHARVPRRKWVRRARSEPRSSTSPAPFASAGRSGRAARATAAASCPGTTRQTSSIAVYSLSRRAAEQPATTIRSPGCSRPSFRIMRRASRSASAVTVHVLTTATSARSADSDRHGARDLQLLSHALGVVLVRFAPEGLEPGSRRAAAAHRGYRLTSLSPHWWNLGSIRSILPGTHPIRRTKIAIHPSAAIDCRPRS